LGNHPEPVTSLRENEPNEHSNCSILVYLSRYPGSHTAALLVVALNVALQSKLPRTFASGITATTKASPAQKFAESEPSKALKEIGTFGEMVVREESKPPPDDAKSNRQSNTFHPRHIPPYTSHQISLIPASDLTCHRSPQDVTDRLDRLIADIRKKYHEPALNSSEGHSAHKKSGDVLIVAHGHILRAFSMRWAGKTLQDGPAFLLEAGGVGTLR
jgi:hypothetical protein